ncbi:MAG: DegV family protein [Oscillospiraceae bacterium]|nr:DegV family protein [Oscillospiraceae bacterium]
MADKKIGITTDCGCDLPDEYLSANDIELVYFYMLTDRGRFRDRDEMTSENVIEYFENGGSRIMTEAPPINEYKDFFRRGLEKHDEIIHISISSGVSESYKNALAARDMLEVGADRIHIVDSLHLSTGLGHIVIKATQMRNDGCGANEIIDCITAMRRFVSTTFISRSTDYLYRNGRLGKPVHQLCHLLNIHPVLTLRDGKIVLKSVEFGSMDSAAKHYIRKELRNISSIDRHRLFITHAGCRVKRISAVKDEAARIGGFDEVIVTKASATISSNCGADTFGLLFVYKH